MRVLLQGRVDLNAVGGGDKVQIEQTAKELKKLGVDVELSTSLDTDYTNFDVIHVFQLDWTPETNLYVNKAKKLGLPIVLSPIHHNVSEVERFDNLFTFGFRRLSKVFFKDQHNRDTLKNIYRSFFNSKKAYPTFKSALKGLKKMHKESLALSDKVLVQTALEAKDLQQTYDVNISWKKVPNGVGEQFINADTNSSLQNIFDFSDYVLCIGRLEARKNQLSIIKAMKKVRQMPEFSSKNVKLVFLGKRSSHHYEYLKLFDELVEENKDWITHINYIDYEKMPTLYKFAKVCVSASWFETTGLTSLEALFCGTNAVASGERAKEYLGDYASYCDPANVDSIASAISKELVSERPQIPEHMRHEYTWANAAKLTLETYNDVLQNYSSKNDRLGEPDLKLDRLS